MGNGTIRAVDSSRDDHESTTAMFESDVDLPSEVSLSAGAVEGMTLPEAEVGVGGSPVGVTGTVSRDDPSTSRTVDVPTTSTHERGEGVTESGYETGSDLDPDEVQMLSEGFTRVEVRLDGSSRTIVVPMEQNLLVNTEDIVPLYSDVEGRPSMLDDAALSSGIANLAHKVSFPPFLISVPCTLL